MTEIRPGQTAAADPAIATRERSRRTWLSTGSSCRHRAIRHAGTARRARKGALRERAEQGTRHSGSSQGCGAQWPRSLILPEDARIVWRNPDSAAGEQYVRYGECNQWQSTSSRTSTSSISASTEQDWALLERAITTLHLRRSSVTVPSMPANIPLSRRTLVPT